MASEKVQTRAERTKAKRQQQVFAKAAIYGV
jgi:hypothetical protein